MRLEVNEICRYPNLKQLIASNDSATISSGDLSGKEQNELALQLLECASELVDKDLEYVVDETTVFIRDFIDN